MRPGANSRRRAVRRGGSLVAAAALGLLTLPVSNAVAARSGGDQVRRVVSFEAKGSNGYRLVVVSFEDYLFVLAQHRPSYALYVTKAGVGKPNGVHEDLGRFGRISVRFRPSGGAARLAKKPTRCSQHVRVRGTVVGKILFQGEQGYTRVDATRAKGTVDEALEGCPSGFDRPAANTSARVPQRVGLFANSKDGRSSIHFACSEGAGSDLSPIGSHDPDRRYFEASLEEKVGRFSILRSTELSSDELESFSFDNSLKSATVAPPPPFSGTATFARTEKSQKGTWLGSLAVSLPGAPDTPLAGPAFNAAMDYDYEGPEPVGPPPPDQVSTAPR